MSRGLGLMSIGRIHYRIRGGIDLGRWDIDVGYENFSGLMVF